MRGRRAIYVVTAVVLVAAGVIVDARLDRRSPRTAAQVLSQPAPTTTALPATTAPPTTAAVVETPISPPTTLGPPGGARRAAPGGSLRVGQAGAAPFPALVADATGASIDLYNGPGGERAQTLDNPTWEGLPVVFLVQQRMGDWLEVQLSMRPNGSTAWVRSADVSLRQVPYRIVVDTGANRLTAYSRQGVFMDVPVAVGTGSTPTPRGNYFIDGAVKVPYDDGPYGAFQLSVSAFSTVYQSFAGGVGQIAIHGTNDPALIGTPASNGCVRMTNEDVTDLAYSVPVGTPVQII